MLYRLSYASKLRNCALRRKSPTDPFQMTGTILKGTIKGKSRANNPLAGSAGLDLGLSPHGKSPLSEDAVSVERRAACSIVIERAEPALCRCFADKRRFVPVLS